MPANSNGRQLALTAAAAAVGAACVAGGLVFLYRRQRKGGCGPLLRARGKQQPLYEVVFVLGGPGAGKGTQCAKLVETFNLVHLSAGDLLREERNRGSELGEMITTYIKEGKIVPAEVTVRLLREAMERARAENGQTKFLVDGFPRNPENLSVWNEKMSGLARVKATLYLNAPEEVMLERLLERGKSSGREDDNAESIKKRFATYRESTMPIIEHFRSEGKLWEVRADRPKEDVFQDVAALFSYQVVFVLGGPGSGKGTNCARIVEEFGYEHLSAGDLLRAERNSKSATAEMINQYIKEGKIVPAHVTVALLRAAMARSSCRKFLVDGFPRNMDNLSVWNTEMEGVAASKLMLFLDCPEEVMEVRMLARGRSDDVAATIKKRFRVFVEDTMPIVAAFERIGRVRHVKADRPIDQVYADVRKAMLPLEKEFESLL